MKKIIFVWFGLLLSMRASADCLPAVSVARIASHFKQFTAAANGGELCETADPTNYRLVKVLLSLENLQIDAPPARGVDDLDFDVLPRNWNDYFTGLVSALEPANDPKTCVGRTLAFVKTGRAADAGKMYYCPYFLEAQSSDLYEGMATLLHEARHLEGGFAHVDCSQGVRKGLRGSCDESVNAHGSYAVTLEVHAKIAAYGTRVHPAARAASRASAIAYAFEAFNNPPGIQRVNLPLLLSTDGSLQILGKQGVITKQKNLPTGVLAMRALTGYSIFPSRLDEKTVTLNTALTTSISQPEQDGWLTAFDTWPISAKVEFRSVHYGHRLNVWLEASRASVSCLGALPNAVEQRVDLSPGAEKFRAFLYPDGYDVGQTKLTVLTESGKWAEIVCPDAGVPTLNWVEPRFGNLKRLVKIGDRVYSLTAKGFLYELRDGKWSAVAETRGNSFVDLQSFESVRFFDESTSR